MKWTKTLDHTEFWQYGLNSKDENGRGKQAIDNDCNTLFSSSVHYGPILLIRHFFIVR